MYAQASFLPFAQRMRPTFWTSSDQLRQKIFIKEGQVSTVLLMGKLSRFAELSLIKKCCSSTKFSGVISLAQHIREETCQVS